MSIRHSLWLFYCVVYGEKPAGKNATDLHKKDNVQNTYLNNNIMYLTSFMRKIS